MQLNQIMACDLVMDKEVIAYRYRFQFQFAGLTMRSTNKKVINVI